MNHRASLTCALALAFVTNTHAALAPEQAKFDKDGNGALDVAERRVFFIHRNNPSYAKYDKNLDGKLSEEERSELQLIEEGKAEDDEASWIKAQTPLRGGPVPAFGEMFPDITPKPVTGFDRLWGVQIRRSLKDIDPYWEDTLKSAGDYATALPKVPPATISFERNLVDKNDAWTAIGILARPFVLKDVGSSVLIPSVELDRIQHEGDPAKERDILIFRMGMDIGLPNIPQPNGIKAGNRLRVNAAFKTDSGIDTETWAGEVEWETSLGPLGGSHPVFSLPLVWYPRAYVRAEMGTRTNDRELLTEDEKDFFRYGPVVALQLMPYFRKGWDDRFLATLEYSYLLSAKADHGVKSFMARFDWALDARGHLKLGIEYRNGALTLEDRNVETLTLGLGVAF